jgi:glycerophosphoryl diester phosphodiesterase
MPVAFRSLLSLALLLALAAPLRAQVLSPNEIPEALSQAQRADLQVKRDGLDKRRAQLGSAVAQHNSRCRGLPEGSPLIAECRTAQLELNSSVAGYVEAVTAFNRELLQAGEARLAQAGRTVDLQGHRGARGLAPENTLPAFAAALSVGVTTLELDVGVTRDGVVVVHHDRTLNPDLARGPDGRWLDGRGPAIRALGYDELQRYDVGRLRPGSDYAKPLGAQKPLDGTRIPRLADLFALARKAGNSDVRFNIETKLSPEAPGETLPPVEFARALIAEIRKAGLTSRATVQSFDWRTLAVVQAEAPEIATVFLTGSKFPDAPKRVRAAGGRIWSPYFLELDQEKLQEARELGLQVVVWTVNEPAHIAAMLDLGVDGIISDRPDLVREEMSRRGMKLPQPTPVLP